MRVKTKEDKTKFLKDDERQDFSKLLLDVAVKVGSTKQHAIAVYLNKNLPQDARAITDNDVSDLQRGKHRSMELRRTVCEAAGMPRLIVKHNYTPDNPEWKNTREYNRPSKDEREAAKQLSITVVNETPSPVDLDKAVDDFVSVLSRYDTTVKLGVFKKLTSAVL